MTIHAAKGLEFNNVLVAKLKKMIAFARTVPNEWSAHGRLAGHRGAPQQEPPSAIRSTHSSSRRPAPSR